MLSSNVNILEQKKKINVEKSLNPTGLIWAFTLPSVVVITNLAVTLCKNVQLTRSDPLTVFLANGECLFTTRYVIPFPSWKGCAIQVKPNPIGPCTVGLYNYNYKSSYLSKFKLQKVASPAHRK